MLGDGRQRKSYLYVGDCVERDPDRARGAEREPGFAVFNLGTDESIVVDDSIATICGHLGVDAGDRAHGRHARLGRRRPLIHLDTHAVRALGWEPTLTIRDAVVRTLDWLEATPVRREEAR